MGRKNEVAMFELIRIDSSYVVIKASLVAILWMCVLGAVAIDLYHGIKRSKASGGFTSSVGIKRTVSKVTLYLSMMGLMLILDVILSIATSTLLPLGIAVLPIFNIGGALVLVVNEWISVREKADQKMMNRIEESSSEMKKIIMDAILVYRNNPAPFDEALRRSAEIEKRKQDEKKIIVDTTV